MFILLIVLTQRLCHEESKWKCKELMSGGGTHSPACCRGLSASASPVIAVVASQPGAAGLGQNATPLLSPGSSCHIFWLSEAHLCCKLTAGGEGSRGGLCLHRGVWPLPSALGRSSALGFVSDTCIKLELIGQGEVRSTVCVRLQLVQDPGCWQLLS